jgi:hypothetical protein
MEGESSMLAIRQAMTVRVGTILLAVTLATGVQGEVSATRGAGARIENGSGQLRGQLRCVECTLKEVRALPPTWPGCLYELAPGDKQVVIEIAPKGVSRPYHHVWWRGADDAFATLTAQEHLFRQFEISGVLREYPPTSGLLDQVSVRFVDEQ